MPFRFNPFTDRLDLTEVGGAGSGQVLFLSGNSGGQVPPDGSGNINVIGAPGTTIAGNPGTNTLTVTQTGQIPWVPITSSQVLLPNTYYYVSQASNIIAQLPTNPNPGDVVALSMGDNLSTLNTWEINNPSYNTNTVTVNGITIGDGTSATAVIESTDSLSAIYLVCISNTLGNPIHWGITDLVGNIFFNKNSPAIDGYITPIGAFGRSPFFNYSIPYFIGSSGSFGQVASSSIVFPNVLVGVANSPPVFTSIESIGAVTKFAVQTGTPTIFPTGGQITVNGATVAAGTNPVRTDGTAADTFAVEVQISQAIASTDATKIGLASFNSADFSVDANGFVSVTSSEYVLQQVRTQTTANVTYTGTTWPYPFPQSGGRLPIITDGAQVFSLDITPISATSILEIKFNVTASTTGNTTGGALFNASSCVASFPTVAGVTVGSYYMTSGTTSTLTFSYRMGIFPGSEAGTLYLNSIPNNPVRSAGPAWGGSVVSSMTITEYES